MAAGVSQSQSGRRDGLLQLAHARLRRGGTTTVRIASPTLRPRRSGRNSALRFRVRGSRCSTPGSRTSTTNTFSATLPGSLPRRQGPSAAAGARSADLASSGRCSSAVGCSVGSKATGSTCSGCATASNTSPPARAVFIGA
jgi:hypothetical protein